MLATRVLAAYLGVRGKQELGLKHEGLSAPHARKNTK